MQCKTDIYARALGLYISPEPPANAQKEKRARFNETPANPQTEKRARFNKDNDIANPSP